MMPTSRGCVVITIKLKLNLALFLYWLMCKTHLTSTLTERNNVTMHFIDVTVTLLTPEPPRPGWSPPPTLAGLQICRQRATDSLSEAVYVSEQACLRWRSTGAYYTAKLTFSHDFPIKVWGAYCTSVRIIFEFYGIQRSTELVNS